MKGKILGFNPEDGTGAIVAEDGSRYRFTLSDWRGDRPPAAGAAVDFERDGGAAKEIYPTGGAVMAALGNVDVSALSSLPPGKVGDLFTRSLAVPLAIASLVACFLPVVSGPAIKLSLLGLGDAVDALMAASAFSSGEGGGAGALRTLLLLRFAAPLSALWLLWAAWNGKNERLGMFAAGGGAVLAVLLVFVLREMALADIPREVRGLIGSVFDFGLGFWLLLLTGVALIASGLGLIRNPLAKQV